MPVYLYYNPIDGFIYKLVSMMMIDPLNYTFNRV